jgi:hypothetical protein
MERKLSDVLADASEILEAVSLELNTKVDTCPTCGAQRAENWKDYKSARSLKAALARVDACISDLELRRGQHGRF